MVDAEHGKGDAPAHRGDLDDRAAALLAHVGDRCTRHAHEPKDIGIELFLDHGIAHAFKGTVHAIAGIVHDHVDAAMVLDDRRKCSIDALGTGHVERVTLDTGLALKGFVFLGGAHRGGDLPPLLRKGEHGCLTDTAGCACDQYCLFHVFDFSGINILILCKFFYRFTLSQQRVNVASTNSWSSVACPSMTRFANALLAPTSWAASNALGSGLMRCWALPWSSSTKRAV